MTPRRQQASLAIRRRASFYPGTLTRADNTSNTMDLSVVLDDQPSIIRQTAMAYIASYIARAKSVTPSMVVSFLEIFQSV